MTKYGSAKKKKRQYVNCRLENRRKNRPYTYHERQPTSAYHHTNNYRFHVSVRWTNIFDRKNQSCVQVNPTKAFDNSTNAAHNIVNSRITNTLLLCIYVNKSFFPTKIAQYLDLQTIGQYSTK